MRNLITIGLSILLLAMMSCKSEISLTDVPNEEKIFWVNSSMIPCTGVAPMQCLEVQENPEIEESEWTYFYSSIEGFDFRPGNRYKIKVSVEKVPEPIPADASALRYRLIEILEEYLDIRHRLSNIYVVEKLENLENPQAMDKALTLEINVAERRYYGFSGCNTIRGAALGITDYDILFGNAAMTMMACDPENMELEQKYTDVLKEIKHYSISQSRLLLLDEHEQIRIVLRNVD